MKNNSEKRKIKNTEEINVKYELKVSEDNFRSQFEEDGKCD